MTRLLPLLLLLIAAVPLRAQDRRIAVTIDDLPAASMADSGEVAWVTGALLDALEAHAVVATGFVNSGKLAGDSATQADRTALLRRWLAAGHRLGNHGAYHLSAADAPLEAMRQDIIAGDSIPRALAAEAASPYGWFRFPFLQDGPTDSVHAVLHALLDSLQLRDAPVTVDSRDWLFAAAWRQAADAGDSATMRQVEAAFRTFVRAALRYHERLARKVTGGPVAHVLLLHANPMTARTLDAVLTDLHAARWAIIPLDTALADPVYARPDRYRGRVGLGWLQRQAIFQRGVRIDDVPVPPAWVAALAAAAPASTAP